MRKNHEGSLGFQMMKALQGIFQPGASRHQAKRSHRDIELITGISTMRCMSADVHQFARFIRLNWPEIKYLAEVKPEMAVAYIAELEDRERSGGRIGRVCASLRKLDAACRKTDIFSQDTPPLLAYKEQGGPGGYHSQSNPLQYSEAQAQAIIAWVSSRDATIASLFTLMWKAGLRVTEAAYLRAQDIDLSTAVITLNMEGNANRTKGGRPRQVTISQDDVSFITDLASHAQEGNHLFKNRQGLPDRARMLVRSACHALGIPCLGTHAFRKAFSVNDYRRNRLNGADDRGALLATSRQLGHNRVDITRQSYVSEEERGKGDSQPKIEKD